MSGITDEQRDENARRFGYPTQAEFEEEEAQDAADLAAFRKLAEEEARKVTHSHEAQAETCRRLVAIHKGTDNVDA